MSKRAGAGCVCTRVRMGNRRHTSQKYAYSRQRREEIRLEAMTESGPSTPPLCTVDGASRVDVRSVSMPSPAPFVHSQSFRSVAIHATTHLIKKPKMLGIGDWGLGPP